MIVAHDALHASVARWSFEPITILLLAVTTIVYATGVRALWARAGTGQGISRWQAAAYGAAIVSMAIALMSPLAGLSDVLFSAHMTQHEIIMLVSAPLLVIAQPGLAYLWAFAPDRRNRIATRLRVPVVHSAWHALTGPLVVFLLHALALWTWHLPALYEAALDNEAIHALEHLCFLLTAALFWWGMLHGRYGRSGYGLAVFYVFLTGMHSTLLGALMTLSGQVWYPRYAAIAENWHADAFADQQLAGAIMWVPSGVVFIAFGLALLSAWLGESERRAGLAHTAALLHSSQEGRPEHRR